ncbi:MAG: hypothetical protein HY785_14110 [Oscillatoriophycideae cyanobacterium NC_groundwater_1537_Pr4_S-0.65um_50_18]|nr:hypothetical protein [Oscillatoriophycideae cyanobacterium NC_groundwater_1537_Pr4_S-0.65um_50_18]
MTFITPDQLIDTLTITPALPESRSRYVEVNAEDELSPIKHLLESIDPDDLDACAKGALEQVGLGNDTADCIFGNCPEPGEEPFDGVRIRALFGGFPPLGQVVISHEAFDRLMSRYFAVIIPFVKQRYPKIAAEPWWAEFLKDAASIEVRAHR